MCILVHIDRHGTIEQRNENCLVTWVPRTASIAIHYVDREGTRTTSTIKRAMVNGDLLEVYTHNSVYRFRVDNPAEAAAGLNERRARWAAEKALSGLINAFA